MRGLFLTERGEASHHRDRVPGVQGLDQQGAPAGQDSRHLGDRRAGLGEDRQHPHAGHRVERSGRKWQRVAAARHVSTEPPGIGGGGPGEARQRVVQPDHRVSAFPEEAHVRAGPAPELEHPAAGRHDATVTSIFKKNEKARELFRSLEPLTDEDFAKVLETAARLAKKYHPEET